MEGIAETFGPRYSGAIDRGNVGAVPNDSILRRFSWAGNDTGYFNSSFRGETSPEISAVHDRTFYNRKVRLPYCYLTLAWD